jgi:hypothetical protein
MAKEKSLGQQLYEAFLNTKPKRWGSEPPPKWDDVFECVQELYKNVAKKLFNKWTQKAVADWKRKRFQDR